MALTSTAIVATNNLVASDLKGNMERINGTLANAQAAKNSLTLLATTYGPYKTELNALAAANPADTWLVNKSAEIDRFAADFAAYSTLADSLIAAIDAILNPVV